MLRLQVFAERLGADRVPRPGVPLPARPGQTSCGFRSTSPSPTAPARCPKNCTSSSTSTTHPLPCTASWRPLPSAIRAKGPPVKYPFVVTTNYDDVLETTLREAGEELDLLYYEAKGKDLGKFWHQPPPGRTPFDRQAPTSTTASLVRPAHRHPEDPRRCNQGRSHRRPRQLRHHRRPLHRLHAEHRGHRPPAGPPAREAENGAITCSSATA